MWKLFATQDAGQDAHIGTACVVECLWSDNGAYLLAVPIEQSPLVGQFFWLDDSFWAEIPAVCACLIAGDGSVVAAPPFLPVGHKIAVAHLDFYHNRAFAVAAPHVGVLSPDDA